MRPRLTKQIRNESEKYGNSTEALVAEAYGIETGTWIGASLDQGVWYDMSMPLSLPLAPGLFLTHQIEFAFTRQVPCMADSTDEACVEIVLRATPDPAELKRLLLHVAQRAGVGHKETFQVSAATYLRLVTDPMTLQSTTVIFGAMRMGRPSRVSSILRSWNTRELTRSAGR